MVRLECENCGNTIEQKPGTTVGPCSRCGSWTGWEIERTATGHIPNMDVDVEWIIEEMEELLDEAENRNISQEKFLRTIINWWLGYVDTRLSMMEEFVRKMGERSESDG